MESTTPTVSPTATGMLIQEEEESSEEASSSVILPARSSAVLGAEHIGGWYKLDRERVPEAFPDFHMAFYQPRKFERAGGCPGLTSLWAASGQHHIMYRKCMHDLQAALAGRVARKVLLSGPAGAGKSVALLGLTEWARASGWIVMYIPSAMALTGGGYFIRRPDSAVWDTPLSAQHILKGMLDVHGAQLKALPQRLAPAGSSPSGGTLQDYCVAGLATDNAQSAVECVLRLKEELCSLPGDQQRVLFVVDNYNALYHTTQYGTLAEPASERRRRALNVEELSLASGMRLLVQDCGQAAVVAGLTLGTHMSSRLRIPAIGCAAYAIPRYSAIETAHALHYMWEVGRAPVAPSQEQVDKVLALSNGNGREVTSLALSLSMLDINLA